MFTGLIEEVGRILSIRTQRGYRRIKIGATKVLEGTSIGDSIAVNGICQTVVSMDSQGFEVEALAETLAKTTAGTWRVRELVHLERALALGDRLGGHLVQGHIQGVGRLAQVRTVGKNWHGRIALPQELAGQCDAEGSIALDGVSLTISKKQGNDVWVNLIPQTLSSTLWAGRRPGYRVNVETDVLNRSKSTLWS